MEDILEILLKEQEENMISKETFLVLVVDDYPDNLTFVGELLEQNGIEVLFASNGSDALQLAGQRHPDLILLDIAMPGMDGYETCQHLKKGEKTKDIPILFLTARVEPNDIIKGFESGGVDYISKPFNLMELLSRVKSHLELKDKHDKLQLMNSKLVEIVKARNIELMEANERLSRLDRAKNDFLIHINHQLRTPLNGIHGYTELLYKSDISEDNREYVREIHKLVSRLVKLSERSLLFTELKTDTYKLSIHPVEVSQAVNKSIAHINERYEEKKVIIRSDLPVNGFKVLADEHLLFRCFNIILDNAVKYSSTYGTVLVKGTVMDSMKVIEIVDNGRGISDEEKEKIFQVFTTHNCADTDNGFGLGLATAKLIMELQSAEIDLASGSSGGTIVKLIFYDWSKTQSV